MSETADDYFVCAEPEVVAGAVDQEIVLLDLRVSKYFKLNTVGAIVWGLVKSPASGSELAGYLAQRYGIEEVTARRDIDVLVDKLAREGLVSVTYDVARSPSP